MQLDKLPMTAQPASYLSLPLAHPSVLSLVRSQKPFAESTIPHTQLAKFSKNVNSAISSRDEEERKLGFELGREIVNQDGEGWVFEDWGKGWVAAGMQLSVGLGQWSAT